MSTCNRKGVLAVMRDGTERAYPSIAAAAAGLGVSQGTISKNLKGRRKPSWRVPYRSVREVSGDDIPSRGKAQAVIFSPPAPSAPSFFRSMKDAADALGIPVPAFSRMFHHDGEIKRGDEVIGYADYSMEEEVRQ